MNFLVPSSPNIDQPAFTANVKIANKRSQSIFETFRPRSILFLSPSFKKPKNQKKKNALLISRKKSRNKLSRAPLRSTFSRRSLGRREKSSETRIGNAWLPTPSFCASHRTSRHTAENSRVARRARETYAPRESVRERERAGRDARERVLGRRR